MKEVITSVDTLAYFDPSKEVTLEVDASKQGLGGSNVSVRKTCCLCIESVECL